MQMSGVPGFTTGGVIHIVVNNQVGKKKQRLNYVLIFPLCCFFFVRWLVFEFLVSQLVKLFILLVTTKFVRNHKNKIMF
jgi:hypothetical protein